MRTLLPASLVNRLFVQRLCLTLIALALISRVLIPEGFMPDFSAHESGKLTLTICDGTSHHGQHGDHTGHAHTPCPYAVGFITSLGGFDTPPLLVQPSVVPVPPQMGQYRFIARRLFANASPRAPPFLS